MKQWNVLLAILFALIVAIFAVINVTNVEVNYLFGTAKWPLILVILGSVLMGGVILGSAGLFRIYSLKRYLKNIEKENETLKEQLKNYEGLTNERTTDEESSTETN